MGRSHRLEVHMGDKSPKAKKRQQQQKGAEKALQAARANWPFVCTWDDHEFANNGFQSFSSYGDRKKLEAARKRDANRAWFEYIPAVLSELEGQPAHDFRPPAPAFGVLGYPPFPLLAAMRF